MAQDCDDDHHHDDQESNGQGSLDDLTNLDRVLEFRGCPPTASLRLANVALFGAGRAVWGAAPVSPGCAAAVESGGQRDWRITESSSLTATAYATVPACS
jgi:hypothetical protein